MTKDTPAGGLPVRRTRASDPLVVDVGWPSLLLLAAVLVGTVLVGDLLLAAVGALALDRVVGVVERLARLPRAVAVAASWTAPGSWRSR